jgi:hypothetical protein
MASQVLAKSWKDGTEEKALDVVEHYAEYLNAPFERPKSQFPFFFSKCEVLLKIAGFQTATLVEYLWRDPEACC